MWNRVEGTAADHTLLVRGQSQRKGCTALGTGESILTFLACEGKEGVYPFLPRAPWGKSGGIISRDGAGMGRRVKGEGDERELLQKKVCLKHQNTILLKKVKSVFISLLMFCSLVLEIPLSPGVRG